MTCTDINIQSTNVTIDVNVDSTTSQISNINLIDSQLINVNYLLAVSTGTGGSGGSGGELTPALKEQYDTAYAHVTTTNNPHETTAEQVGAVPSNLSINGATKTKITYDSKGLVTSGTNATTSDIIDIFNKRYMTDLEKSKLSGIADNANNYVHPTTHLPSIIAQDTNNRFFTDVERTKLIGIEPNSNNYIHPSIHLPSIILQDVNNRFVTDTEKATWNNKLSSYTETDPIFLASQAHNITSTHITVLNNTTNTNTGDETNSTIKSKLGITTISGSNTGDETNQTIVTKLGTDLSNKVDKITGKQLSTEDFTTIEKSKLGSLENYTLPVATDLILGGVKQGSNITIAVDGTITANAQPQVQADWSTSDNIDISFIKNKPTIPTKLSDLSEDTTHRVVTDTEKSTWNGKQDTLTFTPENTANKGQANGYAPLDVNGKIALSLLPSSVMEYKGSWNPTTNIPTLVNGTGDNGDLYRVSVEGDHDFGSGILHYYLGDFVIYDGSVWERSPLADGVASVNNKTGMVILNTDDISDTLQNNKYVTSSEKTAITHSNRTDLDNVSGTNTGDQFTFDGGTP